MPARGHISNVLICFWVKGNVRRSTNVNSQQRFPHYFKHWLKEPPEGATWLISFGAACGCFSLLVVAILGHNLLSFFVR